MPLIRTFYRVSIVDTGFSTTAPADGFIDNIKTWDESAFVWGGTPGTAVPTNLAAGKRKARGWVRWAQLQKHMGDGQSPNYFGSVTQPATAGTIDTNPDQIDFTVGYDREPTVVQTHDELNPGTILYNTDAVKRMAARVFANNYNIALEYYDPTESNGYDAGVTITHEDVDAVAAGGTLALRIADAEANITVTQIANVE